MSALASSVPAVGQAGDRTHAHPSPSPSRFVTAPSAKRTKSTPSPASDLASSLSRSASSSRSRSRPTARRPQIDQRRGVSFETIGEMSAFSKQDSRRETTEMAAKRREMSVPMLSKSLSSVSLSQSTPATDFAQPRHTPVSIPFHIPSPSPQVSMTPRRPIITPLQSKFAEPLPRTHAYPSTAPLPDIPSFLGSPFSTKTARGQYDYRSFSPTKVASTERIGNSDLFAKLDWMEGSEWQVEEVLADDHGMYASPLQPTRMRRDTSGSSSSVDDSSGTSSTSLYSLVREPTGLKSTSRKLSAWGEHNEMDIEDLLANTTPSHAPLRSEAAVEDIVLGSNERYTGPDMSPLMAQSTKHRSKTSTEVSPFQAFFMARTPSQPSPLRDGDSPLVAKARSPLSFLPRLLSSRKSAPSPGDTPPSCPVRTLSFDMGDTQKQDLGASTSSSASTSGANVGLGIGLGVANASRRTDLLSHSFSSDSDETSPSKPPVTRSKASVSPLGPTRIPRRKTIGGNGKRSSPISSARQKALRPSMRRGITEPKAVNASAGAGGLLSPAHAHMSTPTAALFGNVRPSPAAFNSTGLLKKKSAVHVDPPKFGESEPAKRPAVLSPVKPVKSRLVQMTRPSDCSESTRNGMPSTSSGTDASVSVYARAGPKTRGLRRKTSAMFGASASTASLGSEADGKHSPVTPTKGGMGLRILPINREVNTPSPTTPTSINYPFAPSSSLRSVASPFTSSTVAPSSPIDVCSPSKPAGIAARHAMSRHGPLARASNPMLAASFKVQATAAELIVVPGNRLEKDFVIEKSLGQGEFSNVWEVRDRKTGQLFAVKAGRPYTGSKNRLRQLEEISILHELSREPHPHIIPYIDSWEHNSRLFIQTALAPCGDLSTFLLIFAESGGIGEARVWKVLFELASGLAHIHSHNFLHLDIKPSNILITSAGSLQIADFGMSTVLTSTGGVGGVSPALPTAVDGSFVWEERTSASVPVPSPIIDREMEGDREYLCPETLEGTVGKGADVYSLGILLLEASVNVVLPPNGDAWIKLRNDDFSDLPEHYTPREGWTPSDKHHDANGEPLPVLSQRILAVIKGMMLSDPARRMSLADVMGTKELVRLGEWKAFGEGSNRTVKPALEEEEDAKWTAALTA